MPCLVAFLKHFELQGLSTQEFNSAVDQIVETAIDWKYNSIFDI